MIQIINPQNGCFLFNEGNNLVDEQGNNFPIINGIPRFTLQNNYTENFGFQWNIFAETQIDQVKMNEFNQSKIRFFKETGWKPEDLDGLNILEAGSGAGRFSQVILNQTKASLYSFDYSNAVEANLRNNEHFESNRFHLVQASIYEIPFPDNSFDKVFCFGVLQHTPNFEDSISSLVAKTKPGGEIVVDFYRINGWWTKLSAKYLLRPLTRKIQHERLLNIITKNINWMINLFDFLCFLKLGTLTRFLPIADVRNFPSELNSQQRIEWAILDTFDMFSPEYDNPQRIKKVVAMFTRLNVEVTFAGLIYNDELKCPSAVVRAVKKSN